MIKPTVKQITSDSAISGPQFSFSEYAVNTVYHNDGQKIDFVTDGEDLYVFAVRNDENEPTTKPTLKEEAELGRFIKLVSKGATGKDGAPGKQGPAGEVPRISARFDGKQLILKSGTETIAVTGDLTGPAWKPEKQGDQIVGMETKDRTKPEPIDLSDLREKERPLLLRVDSDNTKRSDEISGPANMIQWKYEGDEHGTNLIAIDDLLNIALAGVCTWKSEEDGNGHIGHKEVVKATYDSNKDGKRIISQVELGDVLFDAGPIAKDMQLDIDTLEARLNEIEEILRGINIPSLDGYATEDGVNAQGFLKEIPEVDAYTKNESDRLFQPKGNYLTEHQPLKTVGGQSLVGSGDIPLPEAIDAYSKNEADELFQPKGDYVKGISVNGGTVNRPNNGIVNLEIEEGGQPVDAYNKSESDARYIRGIKVNNGDVLPKDNNGIVNIAISAGETCLFDVKVEGNHLGKTSDGQNGIDLGSMGGGSSDPADLTQLKLRVGDPSDESKRNHLFVSYDGGQTGIDAGEFIDTDTQYELQGYATIQMLEDLYYQKSVLYTKTEIDNMLSGVDVDLTSYRTFTIYQRSASNNESDIHLPNDNIVAVWNVSEGVLDLPSGYTDGTNHPENATIQKPYLGTASATFESKQGSRVSPWDGPFCLTGENGKEGADGKGIEFIYHLGPAGVNGAKPSAPSIDYSKSKKGSDVNDRSKAWWETEASTDSCPGDGNNGYGTDNPQGISDSENEKVEWASIRRSHYDSEEEATVWEDFCSPFIGSMGGEDGMDGDGVEYLFCVTATEEEMEVYRTYIPIVGETYQDFDTRFPNYQTDDGYPKEAGGTPKKGTDNPLDVSENQPYEGVAIRKFNGSTESWGYFSEPKVWGLWGQKTIIQPSDTHYYYRPYTSYIFARSTEDLTERVLKTTGEYNNQTYAQWIGEDPDRKMAFYNNPLAYLITLKRDPNDNSQGIIDPDVVWHDSIPEAESPIHDLYLATNLIGDEEEEETAGDGPVRWGDSVGFQTEYAISDENTDAVYAKLKTLPVLDVYETADPTHDPDGDGIDEDSWRAYVQQNAMGVWKDDNSIVDPTYMATCHKKANGHWSAWVVTKIKGEKSTEPGPAGADGTDIEFVYFRTDREDHRPGMSSTYGTYDGETKVSEDLYEDDFLPMATGEFLSDPTIAKDQKVKIDDDLFWHDHPEGVTEQLSCEGVGMRHSSRDIQGNKVGGEFNIALWSKYGANGRDGDGIEYIYFPLTQAQHEYVQGYTGAGADVQYTGKIPVNNSDVSGDSIHGNHEISEFLPYTNMPGWQSQLRAVDDNPGGTEEKPYVYCSQRKYNGLSSSWGDFGPASLGVDVGSRDNHNCVLHIENDSESVLVNDLNIIDDSFETFTVNIDDLGLRDNTTLLNIDQIAVNGVAFVNFSGQTITPVAGASTTIELDATHSLQITYSGAYVSPDRYNTKQIVLRLTFTEGSEIVAPVAIPISASSNGLVGTDLLTLFPVNVNELIKIGTTVTQDYHTSTRGSYDYDQRTVGITPTSLYQKPIKTVEKVNYGVAFDQDKATAFTSGTSFFGPFSVPNAEREGAPGVNGTLEYDYYFKNNGTLQNSVDAETLIHIRMYHTGNEMRDTDQGNGYADVYFGDHSVDPNNGFLPIDNIIVGVGYPNSSNTPVVTDREEYKIIYNGSTGPQGPEGPEGPEGPQGPKGEDGESVVTYEYLNGTIMRVSAWNDGTTGSTKYWAGETRVLGEGSSEHDGGNEGIKYLDVVSVTSGDKTSGYKCKSNHTKNSTNPANDTVHWSEFSIMGDAAFVNMLVENAAYIENLTVKNLNTAGEGSSALERIVASGNTMYMTDNTGAQRFKLTGDDVNWTTPLATYPQQNTSYYSSYSNETISDSFERSLFGTIAVSAPDSTLTVPDLQITADVNGCTSGQPQDGTSIGINVNVYLYKDGTQHATIGSATLEYSPEDDIDVSNVSISSKSFNVSTGNYTIMLVASINGQRGAQCSYVSIDLTFGSSANNVTVSSTDANENNVQIGSNGMAIQLGNGFAVIFGIDSNSSPLIQLQGTNSQGSTVGIRITSAGLEKNTGSGGGSL